VDLTDLEAAKNAVGDKVVLVGSGFSHLNAKEILKIADGALVGTSLMSHSKITYDKAAQLAEVVFG
jgi:predicted TIM-barrel enzyme